MNITDREKEVLDMAFNEYSNKQIAEELDVKYSTVTATKRNIMLKNKCDSFMGVIKLALEKGILKQ